jgi:hypothetical protein
MKDRSARVIGASSLTASYLCSGLNPSWCSSKAFNGILGAAGCGRTLQIDFGCRRLPEFSGLGYSLAAAGLLVNQASAMQVPAVYACVKIISEDVAKLRPALFRKGKGLKACCRNRSPGCATPEAAKFAAASAAPRCSVPRHLPDEPSPVTARKATSVRKVITVSHSLHICTPLR